MKKDSFKIIVIGDPAVGKTSLVQKFTTGNYTSDYKNTIGAEYFIKNLKIDKKTIELQIWDTVN